MGGGAVVRVSLLIMRETMHGRPEGKNQAQEELGPVQLEAESVGGEGLMWSLSEAMMGLQLGRRPMAIFY